MDLHYPEVFLARELDAMEQTGLWGTSLSSHLLFEVVVIGIYLTVRNATLLCALVYSAEEKLALSFTPHCYFVVKETWAPNLVGPGVVKPDHGQPGGGLEYTSTGPIVLPPPYRMPMRFAEGLGIRGIELDANMVPMSKRRYLFAVDEHTGGTWYYFRAHNPDEVRRKYPTLIYVPDEPNWFTEEYKKMLLAQRCFDIDDDPSSNVLLAALKASADAYFESLGEQVLPPR